MGTGSYLFESFSDAVWLITMSKLSVLDAIVTNWHVTGALPPAGSVSSQEDALSTVAGVRVIPVRGTLLRRAMGLDALSGVGTYLDIRDSVREANFDASVSKIVLDIDSPGGTFDGLLEAAEALKQCSKPTIAVINGMCCSAAYFLACSCKEVVSTSRANLVGSIGVVSKHLDKSMANAQQGLKVTYITAGSEKVLGNPDTPLSDAAIATLQARANKIYEVFLSHVAEGRGLSREDTLKLADGKLFFAEEVIGTLVDRIVSIEDLLI